MRVRHCSPDNSTLCRTFVLRVLFLVWPAASPSCAHHQAIKHRCLLCFSALAPPLLPQRQPYPLWLLQLLAPVSTCASSSA